MACMTEWTSLSVKEETRDDFNESKEQFNEEQDSSVPDLSSDQFLQMLLDTLEHAQKGGYSDDNSNVIDSEVREELEEFRQEWHKEIKKAQQFAEEAKLNTEDIKDGMGR